MSATAVRRSPAKNGRSLHCGRKGKRLAFTLARVTQLYRTTSAVNLKPGVEASSSASR